MRALATLVVVLCTTIGRAEEPKVPKNLVLPTTHPAQAFTEGGKTTIVLKLFSTAPTSVTKTITVNEAVSATVDGKQVIQIVPVEKKVVETVMAVVGWQKVSVTLGEGGVSAHDVAGKPIAAEELMRRLVKETNVLVSAAGPIDPYHLQTTKENTVVIVVPISVLSPVPKK